MVIKVVKMLDEIKLRFEIVEKMEVILGIEGEREDKGMLKKWKNK